MPFPTYVFLTPREAEALLRLVGRDHPDAGALYGPARAHAVSVAACRRLYDRAMVSGGGRTPVTRAALSRVWRKLTEAGA